MDHNYKIPGIELQIERLESRLARAEKQLCASEIELREVRAKILNLKWFLGTAFALATEIAVFAYILHLPGKH